MLAAIDLAAEHDLSVWDFVALAAAADGGCRVVLSEGIDDGFEWRGLLWSARSSMSAIRC